MAVARVPKVTLNDGNKIPILGLGTGNTHSLDSGEYQKIFQEAVEVGYTLFDTAWVYANQLAIGCGLKDLFGAGKVKREDLFIITKVWNTFHKRQAVIQNCNESLQQLQLEYADLLLMHHPTGWKEGYDPIPTDEVGNHLYSDVDYLETWKGLEDCLDMGKAKSIGVSNFNIAQLTRLLGNCRIKPCVNQVESHPYLQQEELLQFCHVNEIIVIVFSSMGSPYDKQIFGPAEECQLGPLLQNPVIAKIAKRHGMTNAQVLLTWAVQRGTVIIPKTIHKDRMIENLQAAFLELTDDDMKEIATLDCNWRAFPMLLFNDHPHFPW